MPTIKSNADSRNNYNEISTFCHDYSDGRFELYNLIKEGMDDIALGNTRPFAKAISDIKRGKEKDELSR